MGGTRLRQAVGPDAVGSSPREACAATGSRRARAGHGPPWAARISRATGPAPQGICDRGAGVIVASVGSATTLRYPQGVCAWCPLQRGQRARRNRVPPRTTRV